MPLRRAQKPMGPDGIHPSGLREPAEVLTKPLSTIYQQSWLTQGGPRRLEVSKHDAHLQGGP